MHKDRMMDLVLTDPDKDISAQASIWNAVRLGADELLKRWDVRLFLSEDDASNVLCQANPPVVGAGKLVEILSVVSLLRSAESMPAREIYNLRGTALPIPFTKDGAERFLWVQPTRLKGMSGWGARPDLLVTTSLECTIRSNDFVIECKHVANLRSNTVRAEFGKGHDLGIKKYHIWSFYKPEPAMVEGAAAMGIELSGVGFNTAAKTHDIAPGQLLDLFTTRLDQSDRNASFAAMLRRAALQLEGGLDAPGKIG